MTVEDAYGMLSRLSPAGMMVLAELHSAGDELEFATLVDRVGWTEEQTGEIVDELSDDEWVQVSGGDVTLEDDDDVRDAARNLHRRLSQFRGAVSDNP